MRSIKGFEQILEHLFEHYFAHDNLSSGVTSSHWEKIGEHTVKKSKGGYSASGLGFGS
jgi:hypothetical protein